MSHKLKVYISSYSRYGNSSEEECIRDLGHEVVDTIEQADSVWFCGGSDIDPKLYGQKNVASSSSSLHNEADYIALDYIKRNTDQFVILLGACRGGQLLNAYSGGNMWQDVDGHTYGDHYVVDVRNGKRYKTNSIHHQMMRPSKDAEIIAVCDENLATKFTDDTGTYCLRGKDYVQVEACYYPNTRSLCIQSHPEWDAKGTRALFADMLREKLPEALQQLQSNKVMETI